LRNAAAALIVAAVTVSAGLASAADPITVRMGHPSVGLHSLPELVAKDAGFFAAEGLKVDSQFMEGGSAAASALVGGSIDAMTGALDHALNMRSKGIKIKLLIGTTALRNWSVVVSKRRHPNVASIKDLKGLRIATPRRGSDGDQIIRYMLDLAGVGQKAVSLVQIGGYNNHLIAIEKGDVDGSILIEPFATAGVQRGELKPIVELLKGEGPEILRKRVWLAAITTESFLAAHHDVGEKLTRAFAKAVRFIDTNPDDALRIAAKHMPSVSDAVLKDIFKKIHDSKFGKPYGTRIDEAAIAAENEFAIKFNLIKTPVPYGDVVATEMSKYW
jgi:NitT/TauT family transport system substrate-binding protein